MASNLPQRYTAAPTFGRSAPPAAPPPAAIPAPPDDTTIFGVVWNSRWLVAACAALAMLAGAIYIANATTVYESTAQVYVPRYEGNYRPDGPIDTPNWIEANPVTQGEMLRTRDVLAATLALPQVRATQTIQQAQDPMEWLQKNLKVSADPKEEIVLVTVKAPDRREAALLANCVVASYLRLQKESSRIGGWGAATAPAAADAAVDPLAPPGAELLHEQQPAAPAASSAVVKAQLARLADALSAAEIARSDAEVRWQNAAAAGDDLDQLLTLASGDGAMLTDYSTLTALRYLQAEIAGLQQRLNTLPAAWGGNHPMRREMEDQLKDLRGRYLADRALAAQGMRQVVAQRLQRAKAHEHELRAALDQQQATAAASARLPMAVIEPAQLARKPAWPRPGRIMAASLGLGLMLGVALAFVQDARRPRPAAAFVYAGGAIEPQLPTSDDPALLPLEIEPAVPVLGAVPRVSSARRLAASTAALDEGASSIHQLRALLQVRAAQDGQKTFAFTSPQRGAGRTSVIVGMGTSLAMAGSRTLIVDCDLASRIAKTSTRGGIDGMILDLGYVHADQAQALTVRSPLQVGIAGMLDGAPLERCLVPASVPNLSLLPAVFATPQHIGKISPAFLDRLIAEAAPHFDLILFDTGPIPGSVEALVVTAKADGTVLVVPPNQSQQDYRRMKSYLRMVGAQVVGAIFNQTRATGPEAPITTPEGVVVVDQPKADARRSTADQAAAAADSQNLGSGILAAAVFSDADSAFAKDSFDATDLSDVTAGITNPKNKPTPKPA